MITAHSIHTHTIYTHERTFQSTAFPLTNHMVNIRSLDGVTVHVVNGTLSIWLCLEVDVGVAERVPRDHIPAHTDGQHVAGV